MESVFDVVIVGSGATGGWAAKHLAEAGLRTAVVEAGSSTNASMFKPGWGRISPGAADAKTMRRSPIQASCYACRAPLDRWFVDDHVHSYVAEDPFLWIRMHVLAGRFLGWDGQCYRLSDLDFKAQTNDGYGDDWPIDYSTLEPHYKAAEAYLMVVGQNESLAQIPDGSFLSPPENNMLVSLLREPLWNKFRRIVTPARLAGMTRHSPSVKTFVAPSIHGEQQTHATPWLALADAAETGNLTLVTDSYVTKILSDGKNVGGISYYDVASGETRELRARSVLLCASTLESTKILLNSELSKEKGVLGSYLMDHIFGGGATGTIDVPRSSISNFDDRCHAVYIPRFQNIENRKNTRFIRGYAFQGTTDLSLTQLDKSSSLLRMKVTLNAYGECLARPANSVKLDYANLDAVGVPRLKIRAAWGPNEKLQMDDATVQATAMLAEAGFANIVPSSYISTPGLAIHELGTARMGNDPEYSVVDANCESHSVRNLFVTDGACWVSSGCQNPTLTMLAITGHACTTIILRDRKCKDRASRQPIPKPRENTK